MVHRGLVTRFTKRIRRVSSTCIFDCLVAAPPARWGSLGFIRGTFSAHLLPSPFFLLHNCERRSSVGTAGPQLRAQPRAPDLSVHCRTWMASSRSFPFSRHWLKSSGFTTAIFFFVAVWKEPLKIQRCTKRQNLNMFDLGKQNPDAGQKQTRHENTLPSYMSVIFSGVIFSCSLLCLRNDGCNLMALYLR